MMNVRVTTHIEHLSLRKKRKIKYNVSPYHTLPFKKKHIYTIGVCLIVNSFTSLTLLSAQTDKQPFGWSARGSPYPSNNKGVNLNSV